MSGPAHFLHQASLRTEGIQGDQNLEMENEETDNRREAAIASTPSLQPNFNPKGLTKDQLSKFRELHKRRLHIKSKSKTKTKPKESTKNSHGIGLAIEDFGADDLIDNKQQSLLNCGDSDDQKKSSSKQDNASMQLASKKRQKLHWGLDTKERWERKSNM